MRALLLTDIQNDVPGGVLAVPDGDKIVAVVNQLQPPFPFVTATPDGPPADHKSFAAGHPGKRICEQIELNGPPQT